MASEESQKAAPAETRVGPFRYGVEFDADAANDYGYAGACLYRSRRIKLDPRQADTELPQTFLHEVLHALGNAYEIPDWDRHKTDAEGRTTDKIDLMASALLQWMRANPEAVAWLVKAG